MERCKKCRYQNNTEFDACHICNNEKDMYREKPTNGGAIRAMSDEELTEFLLNRDLDVLEKASKAVGFTYEVDREQCFVEVIDWLKQEVERDG